jgi:uncharacterized membrane protein YfcA
MTLVAAALLGLLIGGVLGGLGGGGAILTVPILVFVLGQTAQEATTSSLVIVGVTAVIGALGHAHAGLVRWGTGAAFGAAGVAAAYLGTQVNRHIDEQVLLLGFSGIMVLAAAGMLSRRERSPATAAALRLEAPSSGHGGSHRANPEPGQATPGDRVSTAQLSHVDIRSASGSRTVLKVVGAGLAVGFLTGLFGVGGGFVIVPALVLALRFPMPAAVGTSLLIIAINSAAALAARSTHATFDWAVIVPFTLAAVTGTFGGRRVAQRVSGPALVRAFALLLLLVAGYVGISSFLALVR